jgi:hypothetical protein
MTERRKAIMIFVAIWLSAFVLGGFYRLWDEAYLQRIIDIFWIDGTPFLDVMIVNWHVIPIIVLVIIALSTIGAGMVIRKKKEVYE